MVCRAWRAAVSISRNSGLAPAPQFSFSLLPRTAARFPPADHSLAAPQPFTPQIAQFVSLEGA